MPPEWRAVVSSLRAEYTRSDLITQQLLEKVTGACLPVKTHTTRCCWETRPCWRGPTRAYVRSPFLKDFQINYLSTKLTSSSRAFKWHGRKNCRGESVVSGNTPTKNSHRKVAWNVFNTPHPQKSTEPLNGAQSQVLTPSAVTWLALSRCLSLALSWGWLLRQFALSHTHTEGGGTYTHWSLWLIEWPGQEVRLFMFVERSHEYLCFIWSSLSAALGNSEGVWEMRGSEYSPSEGGCPQIHRLGG